jgi:hypothetical protein
LFVSIAPKYLKFAIFEILLIVFTLKFCPTFW